jgi:UDP-GlcNAc3NAcA epimerase
MLELLKNCNLVVTDSGGVQKEAFFNKKHCIIAREETEWVELVSNGFAKIVGSDTDEIIQSFENFQNSSIDFNVNLYGDHVGEHIYNEILKLL